MGLFFKKSKKNGPFRLNLSTSGLGISAGIPGAKVSIGSTGTFVHLGRNGIYYRKKINSSKKNEKFKQVNLNDVFLFNQDEEIITTTNFDNITDSDSSEFVKELEKKDKKIFFYKWLGVLPMIVFAILIFHNNKTVNTYSKAIKERIVFTIKTEGANLREKPSANASIITVAKKNENFQVVNNSGNWLEIQISKESFGFVHNSVGKQSTKQTEIVQSKIEKVKIPPYLLLFFIPLIVTLFIYDKKRKLIEIYYSVEDEYGQLYDLQKKFFKEFQTNRKIWQKTKSKSIINSKYHGGAGNLVDRVPVKKVEYDSLPSPLIKTNVEIPHVSLSNIDLYFFPERLILKKKNKFAGVFYKNLEINETQTRFIENETVPKDATIIGRTWKYVNKNGGPDRRFNNNRQIPMCQYSEYNIKGQNGINEVIMTSRAGGMKNFANYINKVGDFQYQLRELKTITNNDS